MDLLSQPDAPEIDGYAMIAPTISGDTGLTRTPDRGFDVGAFTRTLLRFRPEQGMTPEEGERCPKFNFKKFLFARATGLSRWLRVLSFVANRPDEAPFRYTARAALNMIVTWPDKKLVKMRCPMLIVTAEQDPFVNGQAIATRLPWVLGPEIDLRHEVLLRGDHFTVTMFTVPLFINWLQDICDAQKTERAA